MSGTMVVNGRTVNLPSWVLSPERAKQRERMLASRFFLVKADSLGEVWRCKGCGGRHRYFTLRCVERPWSGLDGALYGLWIQAGAHRGDLSPLGRSRLDGLSRIFGTPAQLGIPMLTGKPLESERDVDLGAIALGIVEPITIAAARSLAARINARGIVPPFSLPGLEPG